jgi:hypothetical protein
LLGEVGNFIGGMVKILILSIIIIALASHCSKPENKDVKAGETTEFEYALSKSDIKDFKADLGNVTNYTVYSPPPKIGFFESLMLKIFEPDYRKEDLKEAIKNSRLIDVNGDYHDSAVSLTVDPAGEREPYVMIELKDVRGKLESYDSFKGVLSIVPEEEFYQKPVKTIESKMTFYFINEKEQVLGQYTIDSQKALPIEIDIEKSKKLYIVAETDYKELFIGAILSPKLVKK